MSSAKKKLTREWKKWKELNEESESVQAEPVNHNILTWSLLLAGPEGSPYEDGVFYVNMEFPSDYPIRPPKVKFVTKIYHPSIKTETGEICKDIINNEWKPTCDIEYIVNKLVNLLASPKDAVESPVEQSIAAMIKDDYDEFFKTAKEWSNKYAGEG